jgi:hypothetical protein
LLRLTYIIESAEMHVISNLCLPWLRRRQGISKNTHLFYGAEGYSDSIHSTNLGDHSRGRVAAYAALDTRALNRFSFNMGAREEVYRSVQGQFSPSVSAGYWLNSRLILIHRQR